MAVDLFGPADAGSPRTVTTRPSVARNTVLVDSFNTPCIGGAAGTGTPITAEWMNQITANLRKVIRNANDLGAGITESNSDDELIWKALRALSNTALREFFFTASGTWTVPNGVTSVLAICIGAGGGGSASGNGSGGGVAGNSGGGGGGGGFGLKVITGLTPGGIITVTVGAGGAAGQVGVNGGNGQAGGASSFGSHITSAGGAGALWGENTLAAGGAGGTCATGGALVVQGTDGGCTGPNVALGSNATMSDTHRIYNRGGIAAGGFSTMALGLSTGAPGRGFGTGGGGATGGSGVAGGAGAGGLIYLRA